jgi:hypothetical protein
VAPAVASGGRVSHRRSPAVPAGERRATASRSRKRDSSRSNLVKAVAGLAFAAVLIFRPAVVTGLADDFSGWFVDVSTADTSEPTQNEQRKKPANQNRGGSQNR